MKSPDPAKTGEGGRGGEKKRKKKRKEIYFQGKRRTKPAPKLAS
jgi:hypothetical protein